MSTSATCWSTSSRTPTTFNCAWCSSWRGRRATSPRSATRTRVSTAGVAPISTTSCASSATSPAPPSASSSATTARPRTSCPPPAPWSRTTSGGVARRCGQTLAPASRSSSTGPATRSMRPAGWSTRSRPCETAGRCRRWRCWCAPTPRRVCSRRSSCASRFPMCWSPACASTSAPRSRTWSPICGCSPIRGTTSRCCAC